MAKNKLTGTQIGFIVLGTILVLLVIGSMIAYVIIQHDNYCREIEPGQSYAVKTRNYVASSVPIKNGEKKMKILSEDYLSNMRKLFIKATKALDDVGIEWCASCGTLLGLMMEGTFLPYDDDLDVNVNWNHREYLFSQNFVDDMYFRDLEVIKLPFSGLQWASKHSSIVRVREPGSKVPVMDIFFRKPVDDSKPFGNWGKVDSWSRYTNLVFNEPAEIWPYELIFPLKRVRIDDMDVVIPNDADKMLRMQYGENFDQIHYPRPILHAHSFPFFFLDKIWLKRNPSTVAIQFKNKT